jgi:hypothetical protein
MDKTVLLRQVDEMVSIITNARLSNTPYYTINGQRQAAGNVIKRLEQLTHGHILEVLRSLAQNTSQVRNMPAYILACLYNIPVSYHSQVQNRRYQENRNDLERQKAEAQSHAQEYQKSQPYHQAKATRKRFHNYTGRKWDHEEMARLDRLYLDKRLAEA